MSPFSLCPLVKDPDAAKDHFASAHAVLWPGEASFSAIRCGVVNATMTRRDLFCFPAPSCDKYSWQVLSVRVLE
jgi:hypothetical protein